MLLLRTRNRPNESHYQKDRIGGERNCVRAMVVSVHVVNRLSRESIIPCNQSPVQVSKMTDTVPEHFWVVIFTVAPKKLLAYKLSQCRVLQLRGQELLPSGAGQSSVHEEIIACNHRLLTCGTVRDKST